MAGSLSRAARVLLGISIAAAARALPPGFEVTTWTTGLKEPVALEFAPDGRLFVAEVGGRVRVVSADGALAATPVVQIDVYTENENGLLGLALDPEFDTNGQIYVFATVSTSEQQILRFTEKDGVGTDLLVVKDRLPTRGTFHSGGGLKFGPDGKLYFSIGDNLSQENAQDLNTLAGKISRINPDGSTPEDNPFRTSTDQPRAIFALGLRNPFRFCFAPDGRLFALDVGSDGAGRREEINLVKAGQNYGWPRVEGRQAPPGDPQFVDPIFDYHEGGAAPVGAVYYTGEQFPAEFDGNLFHLEYVLNRLYRAELDGDAVVRHSVLYEGEGGMVDLAQGPDGALYYCEILGGRVRRIGYAGGEKAVDDDPPDPLANVTQALVTLPKLCGFGVAPLATAALGALLVQRGARRRR